MTAQRIMYCCTFCADNNPEMCGYFDRNDLRAVPDGRWLCASCFDDLTFEERGEDEDGDRKCWNDFPPPRAYVAVEGT